MHVNSNSRIALAAAVTAGLATIALAAVWRADAQRRRERQRIREKALARWDSEGGNIPEVSIGSGEQGSTAP